MQRKGESVGAYGYEENKPRREDDRSPSERENLVDLLLALAERPLNLGHGLVPLDLPVLREVLVGWEREGKDERGGEGKGAEREGERGDVGVAEDEGE